MKILRFFTALVTLMIPLVFLLPSIADNNVREGKTEWFLDNMDRLNNTQDYHPEVASVWPGEKIPDGGYILPGSPFTLNYKSPTREFLSMLGYSPDGQIEPIFLNKYYVYTPPQPSIMKQKINIPPVEGRAAVVLIASKTKLDRAAIAEIVKNPDAKSFPGNIDAVSYTHFFVKNYVKSAVDNKHDQRHDGSSQASGGYNTPYQGGRGGTQYQNQGRQQGGGYNEPMYYPGGGMPQQGPYGMQPIPLSQMGPTYYFYPNGYVSRNYNPYYGYPYFYNRPMYYGYPGQGMYRPMDQRYYVIPNQNGVRTNLQDFIFEANFNQGDFLFGKDGFLGGKFFFDGSNPNPNGLTFRFLPKNIWEHEGPDGSWTREVPNDFDFYLNGQPLPIFGGGPNDPFFSIPLQGLLINGLNSFKLLPKRNENIYGIGPIEISADIKF